MRHISFELKLKMFRKFTLTGRPSPIQVRHWISGGIVIAQVPFGKQYFSIVPEGQKINDFVLDSRKYRLKKKGETNNFRYHDEHRHRNYWFHDHIRSSLKQNFHFPLLSNKHEYLLHIHTDMTKVLVNHEEISFEDNEDIHERFLQVEWWMSNSSANERID